MTPGEIEKKWKVNLQVSFILAAEKYERFLLKNPDVTTEQARIKLREIIDEQCLPELFKEERFMGKFINFPDKYQEQIKFLEELWEEIKDKL